MDEDVKKIWEENKKILETYGIHSLEEVKIKKLPQHLAEKYPEKYGPEHDNYNNYQKDEKLNEIYVLETDKEAYYFGTEKATIQGHIANENLKSGIITPSQDLRKKIKKEMKNYIQKECDKLELDERKINELIAEYASPDKIDMFFHGEGNDLDIMERISEKEPSFNIRIKEMSQVTKLDEELQEICEEKEGNPAEISRNLHKGGNLLGNDKNQEEKNYVLPADVQQASIRLGMPRIKGYIRAKAGEFTTKTDVPYVNRQGGDVLIIRVADSSKNVDRYYVFQDNNLRIPGTRDEEIDKVARKTTQNSKDGTLMRPINIDDKEQYFEYSDTQGLYIQEKIEENLNMSTQDLENYKKEIREELEKYSQEIARIESNEYLLDSQKDELYFKANESFNRNSIKIGEEYGVYSDNVKAMNESADKRTIEKVNEEEEEIEAWEVPGKREH